jgi:competence protein ComEC
LIAVGTVLLFFGAARYSAAIPHPSENDVSLYNDQGHVILTGMIANSPEIRDTSAAMLVEARSIQRADGVSQPVQGLVQVRTISGRDFHYGDVVTVGGTLETPPDAEEGFSYRDYLARRSIFSLMNFAQVSVSGPREGNPVLAALYDFRADAYQKIERLLPEPEASLLQGILLGLDQGISPEVRDSFNAVSASHIIAISGMNIAIVAGLLMSLFRRVVNPNLAVVLTSVGLIVYSLFVGASPSVIRAAVMSILTLIAIQLGRQTYGPASLGFSGLAMTLIDPNTLFDVGFQLSFLATCGLVFFTEPLQNVLTGWLERFLNEGRAKQIVGLLSESLIVTVAAQITTTPLIILVFERFSLISLIPNLLVIPVQAQVMVWGILSVAFAYILWPVAQLLAWIAWLFLAWTVTIVRLFGSLPFASVAVENVSPVLIGGIYILMFLMTVAMQQPEDWRARLWSAIRGSLGIKTLAAGGLVAAILIAVAAAALPDGQLHARFINTRSGAVTLITTPSGRRILVDAGGSGVSLSTAIGDALPFWSRSLDMVIITQSTQSHFSALPDSLNRYTVETLITNGTPPSKAQADIETVVTGKGGRIVVVQPGSRISVGDGVTLSILTSRAGDLDNNDSGDPVSVLIMYKDVRILLPGDQSPVSISALTRQDIAASVLFIPDPANKSLTDPAFVTAVHPTIIITGMAANLPQDVFSALIATGAQLHRLDQATTIDLAADGRQVTVTPRK